MTVRDLYDFAIERGVALDPRGEATIREQMADLQRQYDGLTGQARVMFDTERLRNPFGDTRLLGGDPATEVRRLICGINISSSEILLADRLRDHGQPVDLVVGHHTSPLGGGCGSREDVFLGQRAMLTDFGVPDHLADKLLRPAMSVVEQRSSDYTANQIAAAVGVPLMTIHGPADLYLYHAGYRALREQQPRTVGEVVEISDAWSEVQWLMARGVATQIAVGDTQSPLGRVYCCFYGGWNPTPEVFEALCDAGCGTLWVVATSEALNEVARRRHVSIIVTPHMPADNLGLNGLFDDAMDRFGDFDVVETSNYVRVDRRQQRTA